jgi:kumamolisin
MQGVLKTLGRSFSAHSRKGAVNQRRLGTKVLGGLVSVSPLLTSSAVFAEVTALELSPLVSKSTLVGRVDSNKEIGVLLGIPSSDPAGLAAFVAHVSTSGDPLFHQYIKADEFASRFGGNEADYAALKQWAKANGLRISQESRARTVLTVRGSASQFEALFKTELNNCRTSDGETFYSASVKPTVHQIIAAQSFTNS